MLELQWFLFFFFFLFLSCNKSASKLSIILEHSCYGEVQPVHSASVSDMRALEGPGAPGGEKSYLTLTERPHLYCSALLFNLNEKPSAVFIKMHRVNTMFTWGRQAARLSIRNNNTTRKHFLILHGDCAILLQQRQM